MDFSAYFEQRKREGVNAGGVKTGSTSFADYFEKRSGGIYTKSAQDRKIRVEQEKFDREKAAVDSFNARRKEIEEGTGIFGSINRGIDAFKSQVGSGDTLPELPSASPEYTNFRNQQVQQNDAMGDLSGRAWNASKSAVKGYADASAKSIQEKGMAATSFDAIKGAGKNIGELAMGAAKTASMVSPVTGYSGIRRLIKSVGGEQVEQFVDRNTPEYLKAVDAQLDENGIINYKPSYANEIQKMGGDMAEIGSWFIPITRLGKVAKLEKALSDIPRVSKILEATPKVVKVGGQLMYEVSKDVVDNGLLDAIRGKTWEEIKDNAKMVAAGGGILRLGGKALGKALEGSKNSKILETVEKSVPELSDEERVLANELLTKKTPVDDIVAEIQTRREANGEDIFKGIDDAVDEVPVAKVDEAVPAKTEPSIEPAATPSKIAQDVPNAEKATEVPPTTKNVPADDMAKQNAELQAAKNSEDTAVYGIPKEKAAPKEKTVSNGKVYDAYKGNEKAQNAITEAFVSRGTQKGKKQIVAKADDFIDNLKKDPEPGDVVTVNGKRYELLNNDSGGTNGMNKTTRNMLRNKQPDGKPNEYWAMQEVKDMPEWAEGFNPKDVNRVLDKLENDVQITSKKDKSIANLFFDWVDSKAGVETSKSRSAILDKNNIKEPKKPKWDSSKPRPKEVADEEGKKVAKIARDVQVRAIEKDIADITDEELGRYASTTRAEQAEKLAPIMGDIDRVKRILDGDELLPKDVVDSAFVKAAERYAEMTGDVEIIRSLARSNIVTRTSEAAQSLGFLADRQGSSPLAKIKEIDNARMNAFKSKLKPGETIATKKKEAKDAIKKEARVTVQSLADFIKEIKC